MKRGALAIDLRSPEAFAGAFIPGSMAIPLAMVPGFAGYFLPYDREIVPVADDYRAARAAVRHFIRLGYDRLAGYLGAGMHGWERPAQKPLDITEQISDHYQGNFPCTGGPAAMPKRGPRHMFFRHLRQTCRHVQP